MIAQSNERPPRLTRHTANILDVSATVMFTIGLLAGVVLIVTEPAVLPAGVNWTKAALISISVGAWLHSLAILIRI